VTGNFLSESFCFSDERTKVTVNQEHSIIRVGVCGAAGRMGKEVVKTILAQPDLQLVMAVDKAHVGEDAALIAGNVESCGVVLEADLEQTMHTKQPQVVVDFTAPAVVFGNALTVIKAGGRCVIGTTGLSSQQIAQLEAEAGKTASAVLIAPNFAIGAVLLMKFAQEASQYFDHAEIIELHHNQKLDAPSGTALRTADLMTQAQDRFGRTNVDSAQEKEILLGARGGVTESNIHIHSVRLPGLVAHQEVIFGGVGQTLTIRHDSLDRTSFMPGVALAVRKIITAQGLIHGLENLL
jgi:4-hydroxy-tetrahydrodipicolinate reductase